MRILAFGAHPDDIEGGMGGTIARFTREKQNGMMVVTMIPTEPEVRRKETESAARVLGAELIILDISPDKMIFNRKLVQIFDGIIRKHSPDVVYTHWNHDSHQDHVVVANTVITSTRANNCSLYMYEQTIPGGIVPYSFRAQSFVDISEVIDTKMKSVMTHESQIKINGEWWLYGIKGRAMYRGYQINKKYAEAFELVKQISEI